MRTSHELDAPPWSRVEGTLMTTGKAVRQAYDRCLAQIDLNLGEATILAYLEDEDQALTQVGLGKKTWMSRARVGVHVDSLESKGLVERAPDSEDRRVWLVSLTAAGRRRFEQQLEVDAYVRKHLRAGTTAEERKLLDAVLERIRDNVEDLEPFQPGAC